MDNTKASTLQDIVDATEFISNPLDQYTSYTYNLEWLVVDRETDRRFQQFEGFNIEGISNNEWPSVDDNYITIAKTGASTEFNITDLSVESTHAGNATNSKIAGTAVSLSFSITQVGETSLVDNLHNAIALSGFYSIPQTTFYIKINFVGYDESGKEFQIENSTKVIPFVISQYTGLSTSTDARGTSTVIEGIIPPDKTVMDLDVSMTEDNFSYEIRPTLQETVEHFVDRLNESVKKAHPTLPERLQHTYSVSFSDEFKDFASGSSIDGDIAHGSQNMETGTTTNTGKNIGQVLPGKDIYSILLEICFNSKIIKEELTKSSESWSKLFKITPWIVTKENGYNPIKGTDAYEIEYHFHWEKEPIVQNGIDQVNKIKNVRAVIQEYFDDLHVGKKYDYQFTGKNDQVIDFNVSLDADLAKTYSVPSDYYAFENFLLPDGVEGSIILDEYKKIIDEEEANLVELLKLKDESQDQLTNLRNKKLKTQDGYRAEIIQALVARDGGSTPADVADMYAGRSLVELMVATGEIGADGNFTSDISKELNYSHMKENISKLDKSIATVRGSNQLNTNQARLSQENVDNLIQDALADKVSSAFNHQWKANQNVYDDIIFKDNTDVNAINNANRIILIEDLDNDIVSRMSNEQFEIMLKAQASNPIVFKRLVRTLGDEELYTIKPTDPEHLYLAREKYYESKQFNISMVRANMTIKGDPYWLEGYMPPQMKLKEFGITGGRPGLNAMTTINGGNGLVLISNVADGVDAYENVITRNLITSLYLVRTITSNFQSGIFTQTLSMIKKTEAEYLNPETGVVGDVENLIALDEPTATNPDLSPIPPGLDEIEPRPIFAKPPDTRSWIERVFNKTLDEKMQWTIDSAETKTDDWNDVLSVNPNNLTGVLGQHVAPGLDNAARRNQALFWLEDTKDLRIACKEGSSDSCKAVVEQEKALLGHLGLTLDDKGKPATITAVNTYFNDIIADPSTNTDFILSPQEVAAYQIAVGGELSITGHDPDDIQELVVDATGERTPTIIIQEVNNGTYGESTFRNADNQILDGSNTDALFNAGIPDTIINLPTYTWNEKLYRDQIYYPNANNDWKNTHWFEESVDAVVTEEKVFNPNTRRLEVKKIEADTLTISETSDVNMLGEQINNILTGENLSAEDLAREEAWYDSTVKAIDENIKNEEIVVSDDVRRAMNFRAAAKIRQSVILDSLSEEDYETVAAAAGAINSINENSQTGHRGDITNSVNVKKTETKLKKLSTESTELNANLDGYYFDGVLREAHKKELERVETETAINELSLPGEKLTSVAVVNGEVIQIKNPVVPIDTEEVPILVKTATNTRDIILPGSLKDKLEGAGVGWEYAMANPDKVAQYDEARKIYKSVVDWENGPKVEVEDDDGIMHTVIDYNNIAPIIYTDANGVQQTISDPSTFFGVYTMTYNDMNPMYLGDYDTIKGKIADLFPDIKSGQKSQNVDGKLNTTSGALEISITADKFYIDATTP